jgi:hypothetical protein
LTSGSAYDFSMALPMSLIGSLAEKATPLGLMSGSSLYVELELESVNRVLTTQEPDASTNRGVIGTATSNVVFTKYVVSDIYYNAKVTQISTDYDDVLLSAFGNNPVVLPGIGWRGEQKSTTTSQTFSDKFSFQLSSVKMFLWFLTSESTANGTITNFNVNNSITQRQAGKLNEFWLSLNGTNFPSAPIKAGNSSITNVQYMADVYSHLLRAFNLNSSTEAGGILDHGNYCDALTSVASDSNVKKFISAIDLDRFDSEGEKYMQGINTIGQNMQFNINWTADHSVNQVLYAWVMYDKSYTLIDGLLEVRN